MRCVNSGSSYTSQDIQWTCTTTLPSTLKLDNTNVICEGYDSPDDVYVLKGSCGVEYSLSLTEEGRTKYGNVGNGGSSWEGTGTDGKIFWIIFVAVVAWIFWGAFFKDRNGRGENGGRRARRDNDPPPAYSERYDQPAFTSSSYPSRQRQQDAGGWRPGFWTGMATGGAMGYAAGARNNNRNTFGSRTSGGLFGGGGSQEGYHGGGAGSRSAEGQHESTGYGGTSRR
ncbi:hypothetical protein QBC42DRAFT_280952 [Cladorrhinum samala]|uniref:Store-operated calcium entry-associated regulatory factor n=1 Tax=Cladorrhinum samala TaxID=585594 RepID=A0AAV9H7A8_9PEZI|nr:hypothetical protein QBC42DRAFT_280952 [Cladorrhinum samala]